MKVVKRLHPLQAPVYQHRRNYNAAHGHYYYSPRTQARSSPGQTNSSSPGFPSHNYPTNQPSSLQSSSQSSSGTGGSGGGYGHSSSSSNPHTNASNTSTNPTNSSTSLLYSSDPSSPSASYFSLPSVTSSSTQPSSLLPSSQSASLPSTIGTCTYEDRAEGSTGNCSNDCDGKREARSWHARRGRLNVTLNVAACGIPKRTYAPSQNPLHVYKTHSVPAHTRHRSSHFAAGSTPINTPQDPLQQPCHPPDSTTPACIRGTGSHPPGLNLSVQVGEDAYFVSDMAMGIADGVGGWKKHQVAHQSHSPLSTSLPSKSTSRPCDTQHSVALPDTQTGLESASPSALFARRLMHFCAEELGDDVPHYHRTRPQDQTVSEAAVSTPPTIDPHSSSAPRDELYRAQPSGSSPASAIVDICIPEGHDEYSNSSDFSSTPSSTPFNDTHRISHQLNANHDILYPPSEYPHASLPEPPLPANVVDSSTFNSLKYGSEELDEYNYPYEEYEYGCLEDALDDLSDGIDVLSVLERAYEKTLSAHTHQIDASNGQTQEGPMNPPPSTSTSYMPNPAQTQSSLPQPTSSAPLMTGSSTALVAVLDCIRVPPSSVSDPPRPSPSAHADSAAADATSSLPAVRVNTDINNPGLDAFSQPTVIDSDANDVNFFTPSLISSLPTTTSTAPSLPTQEVDPAELSTTNKAGVQESAAFVPVIKLAHVGDCVAMLVRGEEIVWRSEEMWWDFNTPVQLGPTSPITPSVLKTTAESINANNRSSSTRPATFSTTPSPTWPAADAKVVDGIRSRILGSIPPSAWNASSTSSSSSSPITPTPTSRLKTTTPKVHHLPPLPPRSTASVTTPPKTSTYIPLSTVHTPAAHLITLPVQEDDILILASDGMADNLWDGEVLDEVVKFKRSFERSLSATGKDNDATVRGTEVLGCEGQDSGYESDSNTPSEARKRKMKMRDARRKKEETHKLAAQLSEALCSRARRVSERKRREHVSSNHRHPHRTSSTNAPSSPSGIPRSATSLVSGLRSLRSPLSSMGAIYPRTHEGGPSATPISARFSSSSSATTPFNTSIACADDEEIPFARRSKEYGRKWRGGGKSDDISIVVAIISSRGDVSAT